MRRTLDWRRRIRRKSKKIRNSWLKLGETQKELRSRLILIQIFYISYDYSNPAHCQIMSNMY